MEYEYLKDVYNDFFKTTKNIEQKSNDEVINIDFDTEINKLYLTDESKELLKKIVTYIYNYNSDKRYIPFNITILSKTDYTIFIVFYGRDTCDDDVCIFLSFVFGFIYFSWGR